MSSFGKYPRYLHTLGYLSPDGDWSDTRPSCQPLATNRQPAPSSKKASAFHCASSFLVVEYRAADAGIIDLPTPVVGRIIEDACIAGLYHYTGDNRVQDLIVYDGMDVLASVPELSMTDAIILELT
ncbi:hypothetical protein PG999_001856 [Apiospora kogelbergensis]|uniref:Uncharacterized protein n=1 Tax=Apiospora kogelbergensis TaxID=1337665 RepID=A0AAW0R6R4_9PEZI